VADRPRSVRRIVAHGSAGSLVAALYLTRSGTQWIERQIAAESGAMVDLLAERPSCPARDRGRLVCRCFDVGESPIREAIGNGADSVQALSAATRAGSDCGSCRPLLARLIEETRDVRGAAE